MRCEHCGTTIRDGSHERQHMKDEHPLKWAATL